MIFAICLRQRHAVYYLGIRGYCNGTRQGIQNSLTDGLEVFRTQVL